MTRKADNDTPNHNAAEFSDAAKEWLKKNRETIESANRYVKDNGLPFAAYRGMVWRKHGIIK